jgi:hypothetical protein
MRLTRKDLEDIIDCQQTTIDLQKKIIEQHTEFRSQLERGINYLSQALVVAGAFIKDPADLPGLSDDHEKFGTLLINLALVQSKYKDQTTKNPLDNPRQ